jgi:hypothetical protein
MNKVITADFNKAKLYSFCCEVDLNELRALLEFLSQTIVNDTVLTVLMTSAFDQVLKSISDSCFKLVQIFEHGDLKLASILTHQLFEYGKLSSAEVRERMWALSQNDYKDIFALAFELSLKVYRRCKIQPQIIL